MIFFFFFFLGGGGGRVDLINERTNKLQLRETNRQRVSSFEQTAVFHNNVEGWM